MGGTHAGDDAGHPIAQISIEGEVGRQRHQALGFLQVADFKPGRAHLDAQRFCFVAAGNGTAIVVGEDNNGLVVQIGTKDPLAAHIEVIAIDQCKHGLLPA